MPGQPAPSDGGSCCSRKWPHMTLTSLQEAKRTSNLALKRVIMIPTALKKKGMMVKLCAFSLVKSTSSWSYLVTHIVCVEIENLEPVSSHAVWILAPRWPEQKHPVLNNPGNMSLLAKSQTAKHQHTGCKKCLEAGRCMWVSTRVYWGDGPGSSDSIKGGVWPVVGAVSVWSCCVSVEGRGYVVCFIQELFASQPGPGKVCEHELLASWLLTHSLRERAVVDTDWL